MERLFSWEVTGWAVSIFIGMGFAVLALDDFKLAKICFVMATVDAMGAIILSASRADLSAWTRIVLAFVTVGLIGVLSVQSLRYVDTKRNAKEAKEAPAPGKKTLPSMANQPNLGTISQKKDDQHKVTPSLSRSGNRSSPAGSITQGPGSALSIGQTGGITAGTVNLGPQLRFTAERIEALAKLLATQHGKVAFVTDNADSITLRDANNLCAAFTKAKWSTTTPSTSIHPADIGADGLPVHIPTGVHVFTRAADNLLAEFIKRAIKQGTGIDVHEEIDASIVGNDVQIFVGASE